jgi:hypothetical protein
MKKPLIIGIVLGALAIVLVIGLGVVLGFYYLLGAGTSDVAVEVQPPLRAALPASAVDVQDFYEDMSPDYGYYLTAKISQKDFAAYCASQGLTPHTPERKYSDDDFWLSWKAMRPNSEKSMPWWQPDDRLGDTFVSQNGHNWTMAKYQDGVMYVKAFSH